VIFRRRKPEDLVADALSELEARIAVAADPGMFPGPLNDDMYAESGWCAPSEVMWDLPQISVTRGGIRHK
jgi:hypothetical protein